MTNQVTETLYDKVREFFPELTAQTTAWSQEAPGRYESGTLILSDGRRFRFSWYGAENWVLEVLS